MSECAIRKVVVVGRDAALWLTVPVLQKALAPADVSVTAIELPTALVPSDVYATLPALEALHNQLRIEETTLIRLTRGAFSLGQNFVDTIGDTAPFLHPYGAFGTAISGQDFFAYWLKARRFGLPVALEDFSLTAAAARHGKLLIPNDETELFGRCDYGYHLSAVAYTRALKSIAGQMGIGIHATSSITARRSASGLIDAVLLDSGDEIAGDLFIDASGAETVLNGTSGGGRVNWRNHFPADQIMIASSKPMSSIPAYAEMRAVEHGWVGLYPSQAATHVLHAYSSASCDDDNAFQTASEVSGIELHGAITRPSNPGRASDAWQYNCVAIGAAAVQFDPLHSVEMHSIQLGLVHLLACFPARENHVAQRREYNRLTGSSFDRIRDFQAAHYILNRYGTSPFWTRGRKAPPPPELEHMIATFCARGEIAIFEEESFAADSWRALLCGHGLKADTYRPTIDRTSPDEMKTQFRQMLGFVKEQVLRQPSHDESLRNIMSTASG